MQSEKTENSSCWKISNEKIEILTKEIQDTLNSYPYKLSNDATLKNGHFSNGHYLHSNQYYFAKYYFQSSENCKKLAILFADKLLNLKLTGCTLVGLRNYTGLLLSKVQSLLQEVGYNINYILLDQITGNKFTWQSIPDFDVLEKNFLIVLPITCSCSTYLSVRKFLEDELLFLNSSNGNEWSIENDFINVFLIKDVFFRNKSEVFFVDTGYMTPPNRACIKLDPRLSKLYRNFNWEYVGPDFIQFYNEKPDKPYIAHPLINLFSELSPVESCPYCFPPSGKLCDEKKIFHTNINAETPNSLLELPKFAYSAGLKNSHKAYNQEIIENEVNVFTDLFFNLQHSKQILLSGNYSINGRYYSNYIRGNFFYTKNKTAILDFFTNVLEEILSSTSAENIVFITPSWNHSSSFLDDLLNHKRNNNDAYSIFENRKRNCAVSILRYSYKQEFIDNFMSSHRQLLQNRTRETLIIFFEEVLSIGKTFKLLSDYIKHYNRKNEIENDDYGFDYVFSLVDRTALNVKNEILQKLKSSKNTHPDKSVISFFHLHVPIIAAANLGNPILEQLQQVNRMIEESHLDVLKGYLIHRLFNKKSKGLPEEDSLKESNNKFNLRYFPFETANETITESSYHTYIQFFRSPKLNLLRLFISHEINIFLSQTGSIYDTNFIKHIDSHIWNKISAAKAFFCSDMLSPSRISEVEKGIVHNNIIKLLSNYPYTYYNQIYNEIFNYCLSQMEANSEKVLESGITNFSDFRTFKFYIRRLVQLDSSFLISEKIFKVLKRLYDLKTYPQNSIPLKKQQYFSEVQTISHSIHNLIPPLRDNEIEVFNARLINASYKYNQLSYFLHFILFCYKESVFKNHYRSIKLEELLNSDILLPTFSKEDTNNNQALIKFIQNPYYILITVIKIENIYLLSKLKELHKSKPELFPKYDPKDERPLNERILDYYFETWKSDPIILNAREFVSKYRHSGMGTINNRHVKLSIANMLACVTILGRKEKTNEFRKTMKAVLESVAKILQPGIGDSLGPHEINEKLGYALCIKYRSNSDQTNSSDNIYIISSDESNHDDKLNADGLIYHLIEGLYDMPESNIQTGTKKYKSLLQTPSQIGEQSLMVSFKSDEGYKSFQDTYYSKNHKGESQEKKFDELFKLDIKEEADGKGLSILKSSNLTLMFRLSDSDRKMSTIGKHQIVGKAVLLITNSNKVNAESYNDFMSYEKVRLLMLIKEELIQYLQETTESDTFWETLVNMERIKFVNLMKHGILTYFDSLRHIFKEKETLTKNEIILVKLVNTILETQFKNLSYNIGKDNNQNKLSESNKQSVLDGTVELFSEDDLRDLFTAILELPEITSYTIRDGYDLKIDVQNFRCPKAIYYHVLPELFINIRKQTYLMHRKKHYKIFYDGDCLYIENNYDNTITTNPEQPKENGGREMCKAICKEFGIDLLHIISETVYMTKIIFRKNETRSTSD